MIYKTTKEKLEKIVSKSKSIADVCRKLNIKIAGGNYITLNLKINQWSISTNHFTGRSGYVGKRLNFIKKSLNDVLVENSTYTNTGTLKNRLINEGLKKHYCEICGINSWNDKNITLELHHINGKRSDNRIENLQILCPNCHSQTENYCGTNKVKSDIKLNRLTKKIKEKKKYFCSCGNEIDQRSKICVKCHNKNNRKVERPDINTILLDVEKLGYSATGRKYGVSDTSIKKWIKFGTVEQLAGSPLCKRGSKDMLVRI